jgi:hypothetical protein
MEFIANFSNTDKFKQIKSDPHTVEKIKIVFQFFRECHYRVHIKNTHDGVNYKEKHIKYFDPETQMLNKNVTDKYWFRQSYFERYLMCNAKKFKDEDLMIIYKLRTSL